MMLKSRGNHPKSRFGSSRIPVALLIWDRYITLPPVEFRLYCKCAVDIWVGDHMVMTSRLVGNKWCIVPRRRAQGAMGCLVWTIFLACLGAAQGGEVINTQVTRKVDVSSQFAKVLHGHDYCYYCTAIACCCCCSRRSNLLQVDGGDVTLGSRTAAAAMPLRLGLWLFLTSIL